MKQRKLELYDNTRISSSRTCLRMFMFRHELAWEALGTKPALAFGGSWHKAMDSLWPDMIALKGKEGWLPRWSDVREEIVTKAFAHFMEEWVSRYQMPGIDEMEGQEYNDLRPRVPTTALEMLYVYADERRTFFTTGDIELLAVEKPFVVPLDPKDDSLFYCGRFDKLIRWNGRIHGIEHKTTTAYARNGPFRTSFVEGFSPNSQIDGYLFAGRSEYGREFKNIMVDAALVHNNETAFRWINIERQTEMLDGWLWTARYYINQIQANRRALSEELARNEEPSKYLAAFPQNTSSCIQFETTCTYLDLCKSWANPIGRDIPAGFQFSPWEPFEELELHKVFSAKGRRKA